jgi:hypothetical protein
MSAEARVAVKSATTPKIMYSFLFIAASSDVANSPTLPTECNIGADTVLT